MGNLSLPHDVLPHRSGNCHGVVRLRFHGGPESSPTDSWSIYVNDEVVFTGCIDKCRDWLDLYENQARAHLTETSRAKRSPRGIKSTCVSRVADWLYKCFRTM